MIVKEKDKRKDQIIKELKSEVSDVNTAAKNLENQLNREEQYSRRNCIYIYIYIYATTRHGVTRIQEKEVQNIAAYRKSV